MHGRSTVTAGEWPNPAHASLRLPGARVAAQQRPAASALPHGCRTMPSAQERSRKNNNPKQQARRASLGSRLPLNSARQLAHFPTHATWCHQHEQQQNKPVVHLLGVQVAAQQRLVQAVQSDALDDVDGVCGLENCNVGSWPGPYQKEPPPPLLPKRYSICQPLANSVGQAATGSPITLPSDFDILRPCASRTRECRNTCLKGTSPAGGTIVGRQAIS